MCKEFDFNTSIYNVKPLIINGSCCKYSNVFALKKDRFQRFRPLGLETEDTQFFISYIFTDNNCEANAEYLHVLYYI